CQVRPRLGESFYWARAISRDRFPSWLRRCAKHGLSRSKLWQRWVMGGRLDRILGSLAEKFLEFFPARFGKIYKIANRCRPVPSSPILATISVMENRPN